MEGEMTFTQSLQERLRIIQPTRDLVEQIAQEAQSFQLTPGALELVQLLQKQGKTVYVISGGFEQLILPLTNSLGIPSSQVFANLLVFDEEGRYVSFEDRPTARSGGKLEVIRTIKQQSPSAGVVHIGDGATDLEVKEEVDLFIGFGGNVTRDLVRDQADCFVKEFRTLHSALLSSE